MFYAINFWWWYKYTRISNLFRAGADKVSINTAALKDLSFVEKACNLFGGQSIVISIDYRLINDEVVIFSNSGKVSNNKYFSVFENLENVALVIYW